MSITAIFDLLDICLKILNDWNFDLAAIFWQVRILTNYEMEKMAHAATQQD